MGWFGLTLPQRGVSLGITSVEELFDVAGMAEESKVFHSLWVGDSLLSKPRLDSLALLAALVPITARLRLGVGCMASFPVRDPLLFAQQWASLDVISGGRTILAVCTGIVKKDGVSDAEARLFGLTDRDRAARMYENLEICRRLWSGDDVSFAGRFRSFEHVTLAPHPTQRPCPVWVAANPAPGGSFSSALRRVAEHADGWMSTQSKPGRFESAWLELARQLREVGRDPTSFPTLAYHNVNINDDRVAALDESARFLDAYYGRKHLPENVEAWTAAGPAATCAAQLEALLASGARHIALRITSWRQQEQLTRLVNDVLPAITGVPA